MITLFFLIVIGLAGLAFYLFNQRKGADSQHPHQEVSTAVAQKDKRSGDLD
jgi:hypothetical protein